MCMSNISNKTKREIKICKKKKIQIQTQTEIVYISNLGPSIPSYYNKIPVNMRILNLKIRISNSVLARTMKIIQKLILYNKMGV